MSVKLHGEVFGTGKSGSIVMLHGLLGSGRNWATVARALEEDYAVHVVHLRNHGQSPHAESMRVKTSARSNVIAPPRHN